MSDVSVMRVEDFDSPNGGGFCRARASLGVTSFGMQVENFPPHFEHFPRARSCGRWSGRGLHGTVRLGHAPRRGPSPSPRAGRVRTCGSRGHAQDHHRRSAGTAAGRRGDSGHAVLASRIHREGRCAPWLNKSVRPTQPDMSGVEAEGVGFGLTAGSHRRPPPTDGALQRVVAGRHDQRVAVATGHTLPGDHRSARIERFDRVSLRDTRVHPGKRTTFAVNTAGDPSIAAGDQSRRRGWGAGHIGGADRRGRGVTRGPHMASPPHGQAQ